MIRAARRQIVLTVVLTVAVSAQESSPKPVAGLAAEPLDLEAFPGTLVEQVVVPVPGEIFAVMDKLGSPDWDGEIRAPDRGMPKERSLLALTLGATVAEGFLAVQAQEPDAIREIGKRVLRLSDALGIQDAVLPHYQSMIESTDRADWKAVREEFDRTQSTVRTTMANLRDEELANLISLGGWLRGTQTLTSLISKAYSTDRAELLNQPDLVAHFRGITREMPPKLREEAVIRDLATGLDRIHTVMIQAEGEIAADVVEQIGEIATELLQIFYLDPEGSGTAQGSE